MPNNLSIDDVLMVYTSPVINMKFLIVIAGFLLLNNNVCVGDSSAKVTLFYESLCPYCINFVIKQLYETVVTIPHYIKLDLVPYGNAKRELVDGKWNITCQHGEEECYGNSVHACVLEQSKAKPTTKLVETLKCLMKSNYTNGEIIKCISLGKFDYTRYSRCMLNLRTSLTMKYATRTENNVPKITYVPFIMINDYYNETLSNKASDNLLHTVCQILDPAPKECEDNEYENILLK